MDIRVIMTKCEDYTDELTRKTKTVFPVIGRLLLLSTFVEDGIRMLFHSKTHADHFSLVWNLNYNLSYFLTIVMVINLLCGSLLVMLRYNVFGSGVALAVTIVCQIFIYELYTTYHLLARNISILSAILLLITENILHERKPQRFSQLPSNENDIKITSLMLCVCRLLLNLMLITMVHFDLSYVRLLLCVVSYGLMAFVWCGYKTRMMSFLLAAWLFSYNISINNFWSGGNDWQATRYDFFQTLSAIGGLFILVQTGPGELSIDELKKKW